MYEVSDSANTVHSEKITTTPLCVVVTDGSIEYQINGDRKNLAGGARLDISAGTTYATIVGPNGCNYVLGE